MALPLVNNNNNNNVNHLQNNCDCCGIFNNSSDLLTAKIRLSSNTDNAPVLLTKEQLEMLQRQFAQLQQVVLQQQQSLHNKEIEVLQLQSDNRFKDNAIMTFTSQIEILQQDKVRLEEQKITLTQQNAELIEQNTVLNEEATANEIDVTQGSFSKVIKNSAWNVMYSASYKVQSSIGFIKK